MYIFWVSVSRRIKEGWVSLKEMLKMEHDHPKAK